MRKLICAMAMASILVGCDNSTDKKIDQNFDQVQSELDNLANKNADLEHRISDLEDEVAQLKKRTSSVEDDLQSNRNVARRKKCEAENALIRANDPDCFSFRQ